MKVIDLLNKIANGEIEDGTIFEVLGDFFYKLIVIDENLYCINTYSKQLQLVENKYIGRFINKEYEIVEIGNKIEDTPKEDIPKISKLYINNKLIYDLTPKKDKLIEPITIYTDDNGYSYYIYNEYGTKCSLSTHDKVIVDKINKIIDRINNDEFKEGN